MRDKLSYTSCRAAVMVSSAAALTSLLECLAFKDVSISKTTLALAVSCALNRLVYKNGEIFSLSILRSLLCLFSPYRAKQRKEGS